MITLGGNIIVKNEIESTNNYAKQMVSDKPVEGTVVLAQFQRVGRGQQGNYWESEAGKNLLFSVILYPRFLDAGRQFYLSKIVSLALVEMLQKEAGDVKIKWPNDIYAGNRKIAGILIENSVKGAVIDFSVVGIGLNLNQERFVSDAPNPVSLKQITGKNFPVREQLHKLLKLLEQRYKVLAEGNCDTIDKSYLDHLLGYREWRLYRAGDKEFEAKIIGVGDFGQLQLQLRNNEIREFMFKEVEFVI